MKKKILTYMNFLFFYFIVSLLAIFITNSNAKFHNENNRYKVVKSGYVMIDDVIFTRKQYDSMNKDSRGLVNRAAGPLSIRWPSNTVYYSISTKKKNYLLGKKK